MNPECIKGQSKAEIARALPRVIKTALTSYQRFTAAEEIEDAKSFKAHHDACKVAIAHIDLLIKLAEWVSQQADQDKGKEAGSASIDDDLMSRMIESAREVQKYEGQKYEETRR